MFAVMVILTNRAPTWENVSITEPLPASVDTIVVQRARRLTG